MDYIIQLKNITKGFPGTLANDHISIDIVDGEVHALVGENGAGKSTLMNILYGLYQPDEGEILIHGRPVKFTSSKDSIAERIGMVHQHFMLIPKLTVAENIVVGKEIGTKFKRNQEETNARISELSKQYGLKVDARKKVSALSVSEQQKVEILKVLYREAQILIFDEPTATLTPQEIDEFCEIMLTLKSMGKTIIFISHKLAEVMKISDRITVIRKGKVIGTVNKSETNPDELTRMMVGRDVNLGRKERPELPKSSDLLELCNINYSTVENVKKLNNVSLTLKSGEILGIAGVDENGQEELVKVICGQLKPEAGQLLLNGQDITVAKTRERKDAGIGFVPADRHQDGLVLDFSVAENLILGVHYHERFALGGFWLKNKVIKENAKKLKNDFDIRCANIEVKASTASGGNQQKMIIARETTREPDVFIAVQPTRGLDIGAIEFVQDTLLAQRNNGKGVLLFSLELDEILALSDRIAVMYKGEIVAVVDAKQVTRQELGLMMLGSKKKVGGGEGNE